MNSYPTYDNGLNKGYPSGPPPDNYLVWAILSTIFCCLPLGIVSIVKSTEVNNKWNMGDYEGARKSAEDAKKFAIWSAVSILIILFLYLFFSLVMSILIDAFGN